MHSILIQTAQQPKRTINSRQWPPLPPLSTPAASSHRGEGAGQEHRAGQGVGGGASWTGCSVLLCCPLTCPSLVPGCRLLYPRLASISCPSSLVQREKNSLPIEWGYWPSDSTIRHRTNDFKQLKLKYGNPFPLLYLQIRIISSMCGKELVR